MGKQYKFYARPYGSHVHTSRDCFMLAGAVFQELDYEEITLEEAEKRELGLCECIDKEFELKRYLTIHGFVEMLNRKERKG